LDYRASIIDWLNAANPPNISMDGLLAYYQTVSPRNVFLKSLPKDSNLIDLGAGEGQTAVLRTWPTFPRPDIKLAAISLEDAPGFDDYAEKYIGDFETSLPNFQTKGFDGVLCCHFIEHISSYEMVLEFIRDSLIVGGRAYIEWPHPISKSMPTCGELRDLGFNISTTNFFDDPTHIEPWEMQVIVKKAIDIDLQPEATGQIISPYVSDMMRDVGISSKDQPTLTFAVWGHVGWAQYVTLQRKS